MRLPDLHDLFGRAFEERYVQYEAKADAWGDEELRRKVSAVDLWRKMLTMICSRQGHPWMTFKDPCNLRSPQQHVGRGAFLESLHGDYAEYESASARSRSAISGR